MSAAQGRFRGRVVLGIDPGGSATGLVVRDGNRVLSHAIVLRAEDETGPRGVGIGPEAPGSYLHDVRVHVGLLLGTHQPDVVAVEGVVRPNPHVKRKGRNVITDPAPIIATAIVLGHVSATVPGVLWIPPGKHGANLLAAYPAELITPGERRNGLNRPAPQNSEARHARSAYDVAGAGLVMSRLRASMPATPRAL